MESIRKALDELSASNGGSLVKRVKKMKLTETSSTLFIGLGGMGCKTINKLKEVYLKEFEQTDKVGFLAIDTDDRSLAEVRLAHTGTSGGYLIENEETEQIYTDAVANILIENTPNEVEGWLGDIERKRLSATGAKGVRQCSRVMLCGDVQNYNRIKTKIEQKIAELADLAAINVVLVAGIAGGTGSGTFVDIAYMIKKILVERFNNNRDNYGFWGVFYTPDVQKNVPEIKSDAAKWNPLQRNGYAALKELDYFMSNGSEDNREIVYELRLPGGVVVSSGDSMFESGNVFLVSATPYLQERDDIIAATAKSIMNMYYDVSDKKGAAANSQSTMQSVISTYCNVAPTIIPTWCNLQVGISSDAQNGGCGVEKCDFPAHMNYKYSAFGYRSLYFPRDEIVAYLANKVFAELLGKWKGNNTQKKIDTMLTTHKLKTVSAIANALRTKIFPSQEKLMLSATEMPHKKGILGGLLNADSYTGVEDALKSVKNKVDTALNTIKTPEALGKIAKELVESLIAELDSETYMREHGPYEALEVLNGLSGGELKGAIQYLGEMYTELLKKDNSYVAPVLSALNAADKKVKENQQALLMDRTPTQGEIEEYVQNCYRYQEAYFEYSMYTKVLPTMIQLMQALLLKKNNRTFQIYIKIMDELKNMLNADATILATARAHNDGVVHTYGIDALGIATAKANEDKFERIFSGYVNSQRVTALAAQFVESILGKNQRQKWEDIVDSPEIMAEEIRRLFNEFSKPFMSDILDKFCVIAYSNESDDFSLDAENIEAYWALTAEETDPTKKAQYDWLKQTIRAAAANIVKQLGVNDVDGDAVMIREQVDSLRARRGITGTLMLLAETPRLNEEIRNLAGPECSIAYIPEECKSVVSYVAYRYPYAIPLLYSIKDYAQEYFSAEVNLDTSAGRHLDEQAQNWVTYLPELYGVDTEKYYTVFKKGAAMEIKYPIENHDSVLYAQIKDAVEYGIQNGYIYETTESGRTKYEMIVIPKLEEHKQCLIEAHKNAHAAGEDNSLRKLLEANETIEKRIVKIETHNGPLMGRIGMQSEGVNGLKNIYRVIRSDMHVLRAVLDAKAAYEASKLFEAFSDGVAANEEAALKEEKAESNLNKFEEMIQLFAHMFITKLIKHDVAEKRWSFALAGLKKGEKDDREWVEFFKYSGMRSKLDILANLYEAFNAFCMIDAEYVAAIEEVVDGILGEGEETYLEKRQDIRDECVAVLKNDMLTKIPVSTRLKEIEAEYNKSLKKDCLQLPKIYEGPQTIIDNLTTFYKDLDNLLDVQF